MFEAQTEIHRSFRRRDDIAETQACRRAVGRQVFLTTVAIVDRIAASVVLGDICCPKGVTRKRLNIETSTAVIEEMAVPCEDGDKNQMRLSRREYRKAQFPADLIAFWNLEAKMKETAFADRVLTFHDQLGNFYLCMEGCADKQGNGG